MYTIYNYINIKNCNIIRSNVIITDKLNIDNKIFKIVLNKLFK